MMKTGYRRWLEQQDYDSGTIVAQLHRSERVEKCYGDLDEHFASDHMACLVDKLRYSSEDRRHKVPNPSKIPFVGDVYNNLASYRNAIERYCKFRDAVGEATAESQSDGTQPTIVQIADEGDAGQQIGLERDLQSVLRIGIEQLEPGLVITDSGAERIVDSGFIDITARDAAGATVVIELKVGAVGQRAVAQILSYMGDIAAEEQVGKVRGILVGSSFDAKAKAAASMGPNLSLRKYSVRFTFSDGHSQGETQANQASA